MSRVLALACSPRPGGNCDAAEVLSTKALHAAGVEALGLQLRNHPLRPCLGCGWCNAHPGKCVLDTPGDNASFLFAQFAEADALVLAAPIYFYGPPAQLKAFIDRCQTFWTRPRSANPKPAFPILIGARAGGERLFEASLMILRCALPILGFTVHEPLLLRTLDGPNDLRNRPDVCAQVHDFAIGIATLLAKTQPESEQLAPSRV